MQKESRCRRVERRRLRCEPGGAGSQDLVVMTPGPVAMQAYRNLKNGSFEPIPASQTGLDANGDGVACAVGDFDNDGLPDLAVALRDRVVLYRNLGSGKFEDVTAKVGIRQLNRPAGLTFVDFDHDGDLDLLITGASKEEASPDRTCCGGTTGTRRSRSGPGRRALADRERRPRRRCRTSTTIAPWIWWCGGKTWRSTDSLLQPA